MIFLRFVELERLQRFAADLVLLHLMMPVMDGQTLLRRMREDAAWAKLPVIVMSAGARPSLPEDGSVRFMPKPFELDALLVGMAQATQR